MSYLFRNFHILAFAFAAILAAVLVGLRPGAARDLARELVEDAVEIQYVAEEFYTGVTSVDIASATEHAVSLYTTALQMPTRLLKRVSDELDVAHKRVALNGKPDAQAGRNQ